MLGDNQASLDLVVGVSLIEVEKSETLPDNFAFV